MQRQKLGPSRRFRVIRTAAFLFLALVGLGFASYQWASRQHERIYIILHEGKRGAINHVGKMVVTPESGRIVTGRSQVALDSVLVVEDGEIVFYEGDRKVQRFSPPFPLRQPLDAWSCGASLFLIHVTQNKTSKRIVFDPMAKWQPEQELFPEREFSEETIVVSTSDPLRQPPLTNVKRCFADRTGKLLFAARPFQTLRSLSEGLAEASINGPLGYIDRYGRFVIREKFAETRPFSEGVAFVWKDDSMHPSLIDKTGSELLVWPHAFDDNVSYQFQVFSEGLMPSSGGFYDIGGVLRIPLASPKWKNFKTCGFSEGLAGIYTSEPTLGTGYIDNCGALKIPLDYARFLGRFDHGIAYVVAGQPPVKASGYINRKGEWIWKEQ